MADIADIKVLCFSSDNYNLDELNAMTDNERFELAQVACNFGYDEADVITLQEFQNMFNTDQISEINLYIFFYQEA